MELRSEYKGMEEEKQIEELEKEYVNIDSFNYSKCSLVV
jgi:hypothetical protein